MNFSPDDPKITAYALGELPANEAKEIERALQNSPELRAAVEEIRQTAELLKNEFSAEPTPALSKDEKDAVIATIQPHNVVSLPNRHFWRTAGLSAIAASILCVIAWQMSLPEKEPLSVAQNESAQALTPAADAIRPPASTPPPVSASSPVVVLQEPPREESYGTDRQLASASASVSVERKPSATPETKSVVVLGKLDGNVTSGEKEIAGRTDLSARTKPAIGGVSRLRAKDELAKTATGATPEPEILALNPAPAKPSPKAPPHSPVSEAQKPQQYAFRDSRVGGAGGTASTENGIVAGSTPAARTIPTRTLRPQEPGAPAQTYSRVTSSERRNSWSEDKQLARKSTHTFYAESDFKKSYNFDDNETARYPKYKENEFESVLQNPLSTFSVDVDTASYANVRRFLNEGRMPPRDAVRIEEMINYFSYSYPQPKGDEPFSVNMEVANCPWQPEHRLLRVGLKGKEMAQNKRPPSNFVFLMDVSGSMSPQERLPLIKQSLRMLVKQMTENDRIAIVVYASSSGVVLESTSAVNKEKILEALDRLEAGGSTNGGQGIQRAYALAEEHFIKGGVNRVILCTDGDFNVGITNQDELISLIQRKAKSGVFLSVLGVGTDNYKDALMQKLADKGNGNYHYLDSVEEAHKVLIKQMNGTLVTIAKDVKIQIEFNPAQVSSYRLIGYEKRILAAEDFNNDKKDAGEIGAGHTVTALYEIVPMGAERVQTIAAVDDLKYQRKAVEARTPKREVADGSREMLTLKLRYKKPDGDKSVLREHTLIDQEKKLSQASTDFRFAASVASFGMVLKDSEHKGRANFGSVLELARESKGDDKEGYRAEFINLVKKARELQRD